MVEVANGPLGESIAVLPPALTDAGTNTLLASFKVKVDVSNVAASTGLLKVALTVVTEPSAPGLTLVAPLAGLVPLTLNAAGPGLLVVKTTSTQ